MIHPWFYGLLFIVYVLAEVMRYIRYLRVYQMLNKMNRYDQGTYPIDQRDSKRLTNFDKFLDDIESYPELVEDNFKDMYCSCAELEEMSYEDICESIYDMVERNPKYIKRIKKIVKTYKAYQKKRNRSILKGDPECTEKRLRLRRSDINSWFQLLPVYLVIKLYDSLINSYMRLIGYSVKNVNGIDIWHNGYDPKRGKPIMFFHASVGGVTLQIATLHRYSKKYNLIMPDIPGMNFTDSGDPPFTMKKVCETVLEFTDRHYSPDFTVSSTKFNLMGHSLGNNFCCYLINSHPEMIDTFFCIEGQIFFHRSLKVYKEFDESILNVPITEVMSFPLLHRDVYAQYFVQRLMKLDESFIFDLDSKAASQIKIHMYHSKADAKFLIDAQLKYADLKSIPLDYHIFKGARSHGAFVLNSEFREYIFKQIDILMD
jgi:pimeloyl-ACP methyl ester carboxylesterase